MTPQSPPLRPPLRLALAIADTSQHVLARMAVVQCLRMLQFDQLLIYSDRSQPWLGLPIQPIPAIGSIGDYNRLITQRLAEDLRCDAVLVVQYDGFILDAAQFSPHFAHYDYLGAPWGHLPGCSVGNGGFSWRSRRLVEAVAALPYDGESVPEDVFICSHARAQLEAQGLHFAPRELAAHFAVECVPVRFPTFGFHGVFHLPQVYAAAPHLLVEHLGGRTLARWEPLWRRAWKDQPALLDALERKLVRPAEASFSVSRP